MGDMTEPVVNGEACEWCGAVFVQAHGVPVVCRSCWATAYVAERGGHRRATQKAR